MAQTIAAQRGTTTNAGTGAAGTGTTLFTQSTGIATRVILNSVSIKHDGGNMTRMALLINVNGSGNLALVALKGQSVDGASSYGMAMFPGSSYQPMGSSNTQGTTLLTNTWVQYVANTNAYLGTILTNSRWNLAGPQGNTQSAQNAPVDYVPSQFWMNNGDSLVLLTMNSAGNSVDVVYSFTTITES